MTEGLKNFLDVFFISTGAAAVTQIIPVTVGLLTVVWCAYRIYDLHLSVKLKIKQLKE